MSLEYAVGNMPRHMRFVRSMVSRIDNRMEPSIMAAILWNVSRGKILETSKELLTRQSWCHQYSRSNGTGGMSLHVSGYPMTRVLDGPPQKCRTFEIAVTNHY